MRKSYRHGLLSLTTGAALPCIETGDPRGAPLVLLHGYTDSWRSFEAVMAALPETIRAIAITMRGHGDAEKPEQGYAPRDFAGDIAAALNALGVSQAVIAGHSMGALVAQQFAIDHPARTRALVLAGGFVSARANPAVASYFAEEIAALGEVVPRAFAEEFQRSTLARPIDNDRFNIFVDECLKTPARVWRLAARAMLDCDLSIASRSIAAPARILWGARDALFGAEDQRRLRAALPHAAFAAYEEAGHALHWEEPERFARDLASFVEDVFNETRERA